MNSAVPAIPEVAESLSIILVGNPNVGKSALFGALTGKYVTVSNYPGTTVEVSRGVARTGGGRLEVVDTPGAASFLPFSEDERVTRDILLETPGAAVIAVVDAKNLERGLGLAMQLSEMEIPFVLALNMSDEAREHGIRIDTEGLSRASWAWRRSRPWRSAARECMSSSPRPGTRAPGRGASPVLRSRSSARSMPSRRTCPKPRSSAAPSRSWPFAGTGRSSEWLALRIPAEARGHRSRPLATSLKREIPESVPVRGRPGALARGRGSSRARVRRLPVARARRRRVRRSERPRRRMAGPRDDASDLGMADPRRRPRRGVPLRRAVRRGHAREAPRGPGLRPGWISPLAIRLAQPVHSVGPSLRDLLVGPYGIITMALAYSLALVLPIVGTFFIAFGVLEDSGYLPRLAVMVNRLFKKMGLNGKAVLPMVLGLGCDTMATLTTRILETPKERLIVILLLALGVPVLRAAHGHPRDAGRPLDRGDR